MLLAGDAAGRVAVWDCSSLVQLLAAPAAMPLTDAEVYSRPTRTRTRTRTRTGTRTRTLTVTLGCDQGQLGGRG